ncbi:MAG TPA: GntR family transcriptional regulator [Terrimesophilobacter sp.]|nr:GntR family transcriptional regulator [Terrimesophilobacter sp.]
MLFRIDPETDVPLFEQLAASIRAGIIRGEAAAGERLPAARDLAESLDINVHTVLRAYQELRDQGLLELRRGRGAVVTQRTTDYTALRAAVDDAVTEARAAGVPATALAAMIREAYR